jgi:hypothetical protein
MTSDNPKEGTMKSESGRRLWKSKASGLAGIAAAFVGVLAMTPSPASALDINGLIGAAIVMHAFPRPYYARVPGYHSGSHVAAKHDRDSDDADDGDSRDHDRKSADTSSHQKPAKPTRETREVAQTGSGSDTMVSLDKSKDEPAFSPAR